MAEKDDSDSDGIYRTSMVTHCEKDRRWNQVMALVASGEWYGHSTCHELATEWGLSFDTVARYRSEALRCLRFMVDEDAREEVRALLAARCDRIYRDAMDNAFQIDAEGGHHKQADRRSAAASVRLHAQLYGLLSQRVDISLKDHQDKYAAMSDTELEAEYARLKGDERTNGHAGEVH